MNVAVTSYDEAVVVISQVRGIAPPGGGFCGLVVTRVTLTTPEAPGANSSMVCVSPITIGTPGTMVAE
jgi:hypothetical protein